MNEYRALKAFTNGNTYVAKGATASLSDKQAEFLKRGGFVEAVAPVHAEALAPAPVEETAQAEAKPKARKKADA